MRVLPHRHRANLAGIGTRIPAPWTSSSGCCSREQRRPRTWRRGGAERRQRDHGRGHSRHWPTLSGVLLEQSDFFVTMRLADGTVRAVRKEPGTKVVVTSPLQAHIDLLDEITDTQIHDWWPTWSL